MAVHTFRREATYYWRRRTPRSLAICLGRSHLFMSLRTTSPVTARRLTTQLDAILEDAAMLAENTDLHLSSSQIETMLCAVVQLHLTKLERVALAAKLPSERAPWHAVRHMYEIGRAPENRQHPDRALAEDLANGFWASLPYLDTGLLTSLLAPARRITKPDDFAALVSMVDTEQFRAALGRIACGYDGGQIFDD